MVYIFWQLADIHGKVTANPVCLLDAQTVIGWPVLDKIAGKVDGKYFSVVIVVVDI